MNRKYLIVFLILIAVCVVLFLFWPFSNKSRIEVNTSDVSNKLGIVHFDDLFYQTDTSNFNTEINALKVEYPAFFISNDDNNFWFIQRKNKGAINLYNDKKAIIGNFNELDQEIKSVFVHYYYYYPETDSITLYTYISNLDFGFEVIHANTLFFVATDLYLGPNHPAYKHLPEYQNSSRQPKYIPTDVAEKLALANARIDQNDNSLLNQMIWWGKTLYFIEAMQPSAEKASVIKYNQQQYLFCAKNEIQMWSYFIDNELLFDMDDEIKRKFIEPAPFSKFGMPFDNETPGMVGRWLGWQIVRSYMQANPNVSLQELMKNADSREIFRLSKYKP